MRRLLQKSTRGVCLWVCLLALSGQAISQYPGTCASIGSRANSNGQAASCPNAGGAYASNFAGTTYATPPGSSKTGNLQLRYAGANASLKPFAITRVWLTGSGTTLQSVSFGPAGVPTISGGNTLVNYCFYGSNLATVGTLSFQLTNPETNTVSGICSFDASCNTNCSVVSNPVTLPVDLLYFKAVTNNRSVQLQWATGQEMNNKGFEIERSYGDSAFTAINFVPSAHPDGNSGAQTSYTFSDNNVPAGQNTSYRLRQVDLDGQSVYSPIAVVYLQESAKVQIRSFKGSVFVSFNGIDPMNSYDVAVYDTEGRRIRSNHIHASHEFIISELSKRKLYYVTVKDANGINQLTRAVFIAD